MAAAERSLLESPTAIQGRMKVYNGSNAPILNIPVALRPVPPPGVEGYDRLSDGLRFQINFHQNVLHHRVELSES